MDQARHLIASGDITQGMDRLFRLLRRRRLRLSQEQWTRFVASEVMPHPVREMVHSDPLTYRAFAKPRGYAGDAVMLDYIYGCGSPPAPADDPIPQAIHRYTTGASASRAVRFRRTVIADTIDEIAAGVAHRPKVLSLAAGHLREIELSEAATSGRLAQYVALDQDDASLDVIRREYSHLGVHPIHASIRRVLAGKVTLTDFDFVYAAGLFDYLTQPVGRRLAEIMFDALRPGGRMLVANFLPAIHDVGYMESFMDWYLITRTDAEARALLSGIPADEVSGVQQFHDDDENIVFVTVQKSQ